MDISLTPPSISVIVPVNCGGEKFRRCILGLTKARPRPLEIIVVTDGSNDGSEKVAKQYGARVIGTQVHSGPAAARNRGVGIAKGDILLFIDADTLVYSDVISKVDNIFQSDPTLDALIGSYDDEPDEKNFLSQYKNLVHHYVHQTGCEEASTFWGACGAIRRDVYLGVGGLDENYCRPSIEDIELGYRLKQSGAKIKLCKDLHVKHLKYWGVISLVKTDIFDRAIPWTRLILQHKTLVNDLNLDITNRISVTLVFGLIFSLVCMFWMQGLIFLIMLLGIVLFVINFRLYQFFYRKRGLLFCLGTVPWHWFYFLYSGCSFIIGAILHITDRSDKAKIKR